MLDVPIRSRSTVANDIITVGTEAIAVLAVVLELIVMFGNAAIRTLFNFSFDWAEEVGADSLAVVTFVGAAIAVDKGHVISMELVLDRLQPHARAIPIALSD